MFTPHVIDLLRDAALAHGVPVALVMAVAEIESAGKHELSPGVYNVSSTGAIGLMQLEPATAKALGVDPYDAAQNAHGGAKFLAGLLKRYHGDESKALAAYNWGPSRVDRDLTWPQEVIRYVQKVQSAQARWSTRLGSNSGPDPLAVIAVALGVAFAAGLLHV